MSKTKERRPWQTPFCAACVFCLDREYILFSWKSTLRTLSMQWPHVRRRASCVADGRHHWVGKILWGTRSIHQVPSSSCPPYPHHETLTAHLGGASNGKSLPDYNDSRFQQKLVVLKVSPSAYILSRLLQLCLLFTQNDSDTDPQIHKRTCRRDTF